MPYDTADELWDLEGTDEIDIEVNDALGKEFPDHWEFPATFAASGVRKGKWRSEQEMARAAPFFDGLPIIEGHPYRTKEQAFRMAVPPMELVRGLTKDPVTVRDDAKNVTKVRGILSIFKQNPKTGASHDTYIGKLRAGRIRKLSPAFVYEPGPQYNGMESETYIRPLNLGTLEGATPAACEYDTCGVGVNDDNCPEIDHDPSPKGVESMTNDDKKEEPPAPPVVQAPAPAAPQIDLSRLNIETIQRDNPEVRKQAEELAAAKAKLAEMAEKEKKLAEYEAAAEAQKAAEKEAIIKDFEAKGKAALGDARFNEIYSEDVRKDMTTCEMERAVTGWTPAEPERKPPASPTLRPPSSGGAPAGGTIVQPVEGEGSIMTVRSGGVYDPAGHAQRQRTAPPG